MSSYAINTPKIKFSRKFLHFKSILKKIFGNLNVRIPFEGTQTYEIRLYKGKKEARTYSDETRDSPSLTLQINTLDFDEMEVILFAYQKGIYRPEYARLVLIAYAQTTPLNTHTGVSRGARCLNVGLNPPLLSYFVYARSEGSDETAQMRRLA